MDDFEHGGTFANIAGDIGAGLVGKYCYGREFTGSLGIGKVLDTVGDHTDAYAGAVDAEGAVGGVGGVGGVSLAGGPRRCPFCLAD